MRISVRTFLFYIPLTGLLFMSCYKKDIQFGQVPQNSYVNLAYTDTVAVKLSTVISDSFQTNGATSLLLGCYKDPYVGKIYCRPFFQLDAPSSLPDIPSSAQYDSLIFIVRLNHYYYGDTSKVQTYQVHELAQAISYTYSDKIYNTSYVQEKPVSLGIRTVRFSPAQSDSLVIRLSDSKGLELFDLLKQKSTEVSSSTGFLNYFRGLSLSVDANDTAAVYGLTAGSTMAMRVFYHHTTPVVEQKSIDFPMLSNTYSFNQIVADRTATPLATVAAGTREVSADYTSGFSFSQNGAGLFLKMTFPSLKGILKTDKTVKLTHAELLIRPARLSFDGTRFKLPASMYMQLTDGSNITGEYVLDSTGTQRQYSDPVIDGIYGENTYYRFNVTSYINQLLTNGGTEDDGFFLMGQSTSSSMDLNRLVVEDAAQPAYRVSLRLSLLIVD